MQVDKIFFSKTLIIHFKQFNFVHKFMAFKLGFQQIALTYSTSKYILNVNMKFNLD